MAALDARAAVHGVARRRTSSCSGFEDGVAQLRLEGSCDRAGPRRRRSSWRSGRRCRRRRPTCRHRGGGRRRGGGGCHGLALPLSRTRPAGHVLDVAAPPSSSARRGRRRRHVARGGKRRRHVAGLSQRCAELRRRRWTAGRSTAAHSRVRPAAGGSSCLWPAALDDDRLQLDPVPLLREAEGSGALCEADRPGRGDAGRRRAPDGLGPARRLGAAGAARAVGPEERCDLCGDEVPSDHRHLLTSTSGGSSALRELLGAAVGRPEFRPAGSRTLWLRTSSCPTTVGEFRIPIGLAFPALDVTRRRRRDLSEPGRGDQSELHFETWSRLRRAEPGAARLQPDAEALIVNRWRILRRSRSPRSTAATCWSAWSRRRGRESRAVPAWSGRSRLLRRAAGGGRMSQPEASRRRSAPEPEFKVLGATDRRTPRRRPRLRRAWSEPGGRAGVHDRADGAGDDRAGAARDTTRRRARSSSSCSARRSAGPRPPEPRWRQADALVPAFTGRPPSASRCRRRTTWRSRRRSSSTGCRTARCRWLQLQRHRPLPRRRRPAPDVARARGRARPSSGCRSRRGAT